MCQIHFKASAEIQPPLETVPNDGPFTFVVSDSAFASPLTIVVAETGSSIFGTALSDVSTRLNESLRSASTFDNLPQDINCELTTFVKRLIAKNKSVLRLLQQEMHKYDGHELCNGGVYWSDDGTNWIEIGGGTLGGAVSIKPLYRLDGDWRKHVQSLLDAGEEALLATQHLHEAERAGGGRFQWIEATIAAELAIKEILVRLEPKLEVLLLEVPSPPLKKLYGEVLKAITGEESPHRSALHKGAEKRNQLIHRPQSLKLDPQEVVDYLQDVRSAIKHLLKIDRKRRNHSASAQTDVVLKAVSSEIADRKESPQSSL